METSTSPTHPHDKRAESPVTDEGDFQTENKKPEQSSPLKLHKVVEDTPDQMSAEPMAQSLRIFMIFDIDKNGRIDLTEIKVICKSLNLHPTVRELKTMINEVSDRDDFSVTFEQFRAMRVL